MRVRRVPLSAIRLPVILIRLPEVPTKERSNCPGPRDCSSCLTEATSNSEVWAQAVAQPIKNTERAKDLGI